MATKRKPTKLQGSSLREAAAALGITRAALLKHIDKGLPAPLVRERRTVDIDAARKWIAAQEAEGIADERTVLPLSPDDPRYQRDFASARLKAYQMAEKHGHAIPRAALVARHADSLTRLNGRLKTLPAALGTELALVSRSTAAAILAPAIADALQELDSDDASAWPRPAPIQIEFPKADENLFEQHAPRLTTADARGQLAAMQASRFNAEADMLESSLIAYADVFRILGEKCDAIRARMRLIPERVAAHLADGNNPRHVITAALQYESDLARMDCGGKSDHVPEMPAPALADDEGADIESEDANDDFEWEDPLGSCHRGTNR